MRRDLDKEIATSVSIAPALSDASANGTGVDLTGFGTAAVVLVAGTITDGTHAVKLQDSDDNSTWADVSSGNRTGSFTSLTSSSGGGATQEVGYLGIKRYLRVVTTVTGSPATGGVYGAVVVKGAPRKAPQ